MQKPVIGVTMSRSTSQYGYPILTLTEAYTIALINAGACPLLIPLGVPEDSISDFLSKIDGILFTGGGDVHPDQYGGLNHPLVSEVDTDRDRIEIYLLHATVKQGLPFLGICRGLQVINIALGGTIYEDILDQRSHALRHSYFPEKPRNYLAHNVEIVPESHLSQIITPRTIAVNSLHHQGIKDLAPGLSASAFAPDGLIEAFELNANRFGLAVQWHPEWLIPNTEMERLFQEFVSQARSN